MSYTPHTPQERQAMLEAIGVASVEELFEAAPAELRLREPLKLPPAMSEQELAERLETLAARNAHAGSMLCFLGGGAYDHFIPAVVDAVAARGEFYTSYTPYQPEVSQGNLQAMFEYQTLICQLTGLDVSNASLYDGGSATAEAALMCLAATGRHGSVVVADTVHPEHREILATYLANSDTELRVVEAPEGAAAPERLAAAADEQTGCVIVQHPNFFGCLEDVAGAARAAHEAGALLVVVFDPISTGLLRRPGDLGADVAVAEGQSLGSPLQYGGPYLGVMACRERFLRRLPGRIAGQTTDRRGRRCWVLTLQTREQHIRREKATSNICTNQGLLALRAAVYLAALGPQGLRETARLCVRKAHYAADQLTTHRRFALRFSQPFFKEFVVRDRAGEVAELLASARRQGVLAGVPLARWRADLEDCFLVAVTEKRTREHIDRWARALTSAAAPAETADA